jgi:phage major head subunit gpT-like protein/phage head maturation protease
MKTPIPGDLRASTPPKPLTINATAPVEIVAAEGADGSPKRPTFSILGYTGAAMSVAGFYTPVVVDLAGLDATRQQIPALRDHDSGRIVGQTESIAINESGVTLSGTITGDNADAVEVIGQSRNGFRWQASIGASIVRQESVKAGETARVNGREVAGPILIARESRLKEISFVAIGADSQTSASVAAVDPLASQTRESNMQLDQWIEAKGFDPATITDTQRASFEALHNAETSIERGSKGKPKGEPNPDGVTADGRKDLDASYNEIKARQERHSAIKAMATEFMLERPSVMEDIKALADAAIEGNSSVNEFELAARRAMGMISNPAIHVKGGARQKADNKVVEAALCVAGRLPELEKRYDDQTLNASYDLFPNGVRLHELFQIAARENGHSQRISANDVRGLFDAAFRPAGGSIQASGFSTFSLPGILSNTANKFLVAGFSHVESAWRSVAAIRTASDFKAITSYSLTGDMTYEKLGPGGELKHATVGELPYTNRVETYGKMFAITRQDIINDDLSALTDVPRKLGRGAGLAMNEVFWAEFMNNAAFFTTGNANLLAGVTVGTNDSRLGIEGLTRGSTQFMLQTDPDGKPVAIQPRILLVPPSLKVPAMTLMNSTEIRDTTASTVFGTSNPHAGNYSVVVSTYLQSPAITGNSATAWYLLADPNDIAAIEVRFLNGRDTPIVESADADFNTLGVQMRGYHDFGVALQEYRAGIKMKGAA